MAFSITQFQANLQNSLQALDNNFATVSAAAPISCSIAGTNTLALTQSAAGLVPTVAIAAYTQGMLFVGVAASTNTGAVTAAVGSLSALNVYKDTPSGPALLTGGEIIAANAISLLYDSALNSGAGGFHLTSSTALTGVAIAPASVRVGGNSTLTNLLSGTVSITFSATPGWSSNDVAFSVTAALASSLPAVGDFMLVNPPSLGLAGVDFRGYVTGVGSISSVASAATINIRLLNAASASLASNSGIYRYAAIRTVP